MDCDQTQPIHPRMRALLQAQYKAVGDQATEVRLDQMRSQMAVFKKNLEDFATKHRYE